MDGPQVDLDMIMDGYGYVFFNGLDWMDIPTFEYIRVFQSTTTKRNLLKMLSSFNVFR